MTSAAAGPPTPSNADELRAFVTMIRLARAFRLGFVICNHVSLQERVLTETRAALGDAPVAELHLDPARPVIRQLHDAVDGQGVVALFVFDLERAIDPTSDAAPAIDALNLSRDALVQRFPCPVVFWGPEYAVREFARRAPDLWSGRSGVFEFSPDLDDLARTITSVDVGWEVPPAERARRYLLLHDVWREVAERDGVESAMRSALLSRLGDAAGTQNRWREAEERYGEALAVYHEIGDRHGQASARLGAGRVKLARGLLDAARVELREALGIAREIGARHAEAQAALALAELEAEGGDPAGAAAWYRQGAGLLRSIGLDDQAMHYDDLADALEHGEGAQAAGP